MDISIANTWSVVGLIVDVAIVGLLIFALIRGFKHGFVYCVVWVAAILAAVIGARLVSALFAEPVANFFYSKAEEPVAKAAENLAPELDNIDWSLIDFDSERTALTDEEYQYLRQNEGVAGVAKALDSVGVKETRQKELFYSWAKSIRKSDEKASVFIRGKATEAARAAILLLTKALMIVIVFIIVLVLFRLLGKGLSGLVSKIPVVGTLDRGLGGALSFVAFAALLFLALYGLEHLFPETYAKLTAGAPVTNFAAGVNPLSKFFGAA